jgi:hypothetical protein
MAADVLTRQRKRRERLRAHGLQEISVAVRPDDRARMRHIAAALNAGHPVSPRLIRALDVVRTQKDALAANGVERAGVFGSTARGEDRPDSDIDLVVDFGGSTAIHPYRLIESTRILEAAFAEAFPEVAIEVSCREFMKPMIRERAETEAVYAY